MELLNIFIVPVISLGIFSKRNNRKIDINGDILVMYSRFAVLVSIFTFGAMKIMETTIGLGALPSSPVYTVVASIIAFLLPYIYEIINKYLDIKCVIKKMKKPFIKSARIIFFVIFSINLFFFIVGSKALSWYKDRFGVTIIEILYTIKSPLKGADTSFLHTLILDVLLYTMIWALAVFAIVLIHKIKQIVVVETVLHKKIRINVLCWIMYISFAYSLFGAVYTIVDAYNTLDVKTYVDSVMAETSIYEDYYIYPEVDKIKATKPKNLLHIYLESMETTYASKDIGGYQQELFIA